MRIAAGRTLLMLIRFDAWLVLRKRLSAAQSRYAPRAVLDACYCCMPFGGAPTSICRLRAQQSLAPFRAVLWLALWPMGEQTPIQHDSCGLPASSACNRGAILLACMLCFVVDSSFFVLFSVSLFSGSFISVCAVMLQLWRCATWATAQRFCHGFDTATNSHATTLKHDGHCTDERSCGVKSICSANCHSDWCCRIKILIAHMHHTRIRHNFGRTARVCVEIEQKPQNAFFVTQNTDEIVIFGCTAPMQIVIRHQPENPFRIARKNATFPF